MQRPAPGLDSCEWLGVWDDMVTYLGQRAPLVFFKLTPEKVQNPDKLVKYLQKVCCHPGNSRETQITATCWGLAHTYRALFNLIQCFKGERGEMKRQALRLALPPQPALQPLQPSRQSQPPQPAPPLLQPLALSWLPQWAWQLLQLQLQLQASQLSPVTNLCRLHLPL